MPLRAYVPPGRKTFYLRGTVKAGQGRRSVYESTGIGAGEPGGAAKAEEIRLRREGEIYHEILYGAGATITFTQAAADYCAARNRRRLSANPSLAGLPDKEAAYVAKWVAFLRRRGVSDIPLADFCAEAGPHLSAYFDMLHVAKGNRLPTMTREAGVFEAVMNHALAQGWIQPGFPRPDLPAYDVTDQPVNKWLYAEEIRLFVRLAPRHLKPFVAGLFATGIRGGELLFVSRRPPRFNDPNGSGLSLDPGHEFVYLGRSKSGKPIIRSLPDWYVAMLHDYLAGRKDGHDALFLTDRGRPYRRPRHQRGFAVKTAWKRLRARVAAVIDRLARCKAGGDARHAARLTARAAICRQVTPHWGRHNAASHFLMKGMSDAAAQRAGGWQSPRMLKRYQHLTAEQAKDMANQLDFGPVDRAKSVQTKTG